jgi:glucose/arabinose dehydrogenase
MRFLHVYRSLLLSFALAAAVGLVNSTMSAQSGSNADNESKKPSCTSDDSGLKLPAGFCATVFAEGIGHARHMVVAQSGVVYVNTWSGDYYGNDKLHEGGFLVALQDKTGAGKADVIERFGETVQKGGAGGTGIGMYKGSLYAEINDRVVRYSLPAGAIVPKDGPETIVSGLPLEGDHPMHPFIISADGSLYVDVATATNSCQAKNRQPKIPGNDPCTELETRGGVWRYDANKTDQKFSPAERYATGIRNAEGFAFDSAGRRVGAFEIRRRLRLAGVLLRWGAKEARSCAGVRRRRRQESWRVRGEIGSGGRISSALGAERNGALRRETISQTLS